MTPLEVAEILRIGYTEFEWGYRFWFGGGFEDAEAFIELCNENRPDNHKWALVASTTAYYQRHDVSWFCGSPEQWEAQS